jgi:nucleoside-diphosphate-sugar epimerase
MKFNSIFITGGAGYCGSRLVPFLLSKGMKVTVFDLFFFGNYLPKDNKNLFLIKGDIRDIKKIREESKNHDIFLNLACISNDASFELDEKLSTSINLDAFEPIVIAAKKNGIKKFIYASSSSVYGISEKKNVTEDHELVPLTLYNKYKGMCEPYLLNNTDNNFIGTIFRPATVCGYAPRMRLDLSVNILTTHAIVKNKILVFGGNQLRPNLHVQDYCDAVFELINAEDKKIKNQIFNIGYENLSIINIAKLVKKIVEKEFKKEISIEVQESNDNRSYHINSDKIFNVLGFKPNKNLEFAVKELCQKFKENKIANPFSDDRFYNVKTLKKINAQ